MKKNIALLTGIIILGTSAGVSLFADTDPTIPTATAVAASTPQDTAVTISLTGASNDSGSITFATTTSPTHGTLGAITGTDVEYTPETGYAGTDSFEFIATEGATSSTPALVTISIDAPTPVAPTGTAHIVVRDQAGIATSSDVVFAFGTTTIAATAGDSHEVAASSTLAALVSLDAVAHEFNITDLQYNSSFSAFYLRCIAFPAATSTAECDNWQYAVNGTTPGVGMDQFVLHDGDTVYVYYGYPRIVELSTTTVTSGTPVTATAKQYDPAAGIYMAVTQPYTIGATQPDPSNPWSPFEIATSTVDGSGQAIFTLAATGTYDFGIKEDYYYPTTALTVTDATSTSSSGGSGGFSGGSDPYAQTSFSVPNALAFLASHQNADGSFANPLLTDWAALALANYPGTARDKLKSYLTTHVPSFTSTTDYERHAMALMALGINPFNGTSANTIAPILAAFDGTQVGDTSLITDDIFALFPLLHAGYVQFDPTIRAIATHIIAKQSANGSWENSADVTAAAMQALGPLYTIPGYGAALGKGAGYLATTEKADGGWDNVDSTSWVMTMVNSVKEGDPTRAPVFVATSGKTPADALNVAQQQDGGVRATTDPTDTRVWSTAYAIVAGSGKSWISLMQAFTGPAAASTFSGGSDPYATESTATSTATSTPVIATSTEPVATSTPPVASSTPEVIASTTTTTTSAPVVQKPEPKPVAKKLARATPKPATSSAPTPTTTPSPTQTAAAADAQPSFFGRIVGWFKHLFGW